MSVINLSNKGNKIKVTVVGLSAVQYPDKSNFSLSYNSTNNTASIQFNVTQGRLYYQENVLTDITINGVNITNQTILETQFDLLMATSNSASQGNMDTTIATLAALATSGASGDQTNTNSKGVLLVVDITAITGTGASIIIIIQGKDLASGKYYNILTSASLIAIGTTLLVVYPGGLNTANVSTPQPLPKVWRVSYTIAGTIPAITATIGASTIV